MSTFDAPLENQRKHGTAKSAEAAIWNELTKESQSKNGSDVKKPDGDLSFVFARAEDDPASEVAKLRKESETILRKARPDYATAAELLKKELELLKKLHPDGETADFIKPTASLGHCLLALSKGKGSKEADEYFAKALKLIDANPKKDEQEKRDQEIYRFSILQGKGNNNRKLAISATDPKDRETFNTKAEKEFTDALAALKKGLKPEDFEKSRDRLNTLISLAVVENALGKKESFVKHRKEIKQHPNYDDDVQSRLDGGLVMNAVCEASDKSPALRAVMNETAVCPWGPMMSVGVKEDSDEASYDTTSSRTILGADIPPEKRPQMYAYATTLGMKQGLSKLYGGDDPVDVDTYKRVQVDRFVAAYQAEAKVAKDRGLEATIEDSAGKKHDLTKLTAKEIGDIVKELDGFKTHCLKGYAGHVLHFADNKKILTDNNLLKKGY